MRQLDDFIIDTSNKICLDIANQFIKSNHQVTPFDIETIAGKVNISEYSDVYQGHRVYLDGELVGTLRTKLRDFRIDRAKESLDSVSVPDWDRMVSILAGHLYDINMFKSKLLSGEPKIYQVKLDIDLDLIIQTTLLALALCPGQIPLYLKDAKKSLIGSIKSRIETTLTSPMKLMDKIDVVRNLEHRLKQLEE